MLRTRQIHQSQNQMPTNEKTKAPKVQKGSSGIISVLEKVVPFLFAKKKKQEEIRKAQERIDNTPVKKTVHKVVASKKVTKKSSPKKSVSTKSVRQAVATLEARKIVKKLDELSVDLEPSAVAPKPEKKLKGAFVLKEEKKPEDANEIKAELLAEEDAFLEKAVQKKVEAAPTKTSKVWAMLNMRLFEKDPLAHIDKQKKPVLTEKNIAEDSFLSRTEQKKPTDVVGTVAEKEEVSDMEEVTSGAAKTVGEKNEQKKGRMLSAADLQKETREAKEAAKRLEKEVKEIKKEMKMGEKDREKDMEELEKKRQVDAKTAEEAVPHRKVAAVKRSGLSKFFASVGHIGLGKERMRFVQNLATMLNAGLPLIDSLKTLQLETRAKPMRKVLQHILDSVENGSALWRAMDEQDLFSLHAIALVRIGEEAGNLAQNVEYLAIQEEKDHELRSKVKMAMIYPTIVMTIMFIIVIGLGMFVLPNLIGVLYSLNVELPLVTRIVIAFSNMFTTYGAVAVPASMFGFFALIIIAKYTPLKRVFQWMMFKVPGIGSLAREATIARFGVILGGLLKAGVPVIEAMQSLVEVTPIVSYRKLYSRMLDHIAIGDSFSKSFAAIKGSQKLLPPSVQQLVITGEKSGALSEIMLKVADIYDKKATETAQKLPVILEPILLLFIGGLVGTIAFAIIVPIYSIVGNVGR